MEINFTCTGRTEAEIVEAADKILAKFLGDMAPLSPPALTIRVRPLAIAYGSEHPVRWEADVEATI